MDSLAPKTVRDRFVDLIEEGQVRREERPMVMKAAAD